MKKSSLQRRLVYRICKAQLVCAVEVKELKNRFAQSKEKRNKLFADLAVGPYEKKLWPRSCKCCPRPQDLGHSFFSYTDLPGGE